MLSFFLCNLGMKRLLSFIWKILSMPSFDAFKEGAEQGDAPAQFNLALLILRRPRRPAELHGGGEVVQEGC